ncbi:MAG: M48 family metallopeptidase [Deltaproteobacteria bacterium]|nr:M48 family metallopeptidase [Deltaproteobacteria bacterium]
MEQTQHWFFWLFLAFFLISHTYEWSLDVLNLKEIKRHISKIPELFSNMITFEDYQKSITYTQAKTKFGWYKTLFELTLLWVFILGGWFGKFDQILANSFATGSIWHQVSYPFAIGAIFYLAGLPFTIYYQFVLEERFGFNRTTAKTFILDQIKSGFLAVLLGVPLLMLIFKTVSWLGDYWWLGTWGLVMFFQFLVAALFPVLFAPLFYKFTPLEEGELKNRIEELAQKIKFKMMGVFTIDGSKRSSHSNAFFAGMGKARRIVLFDTLLKQLNQDEIIAVLAHEMGHSQKKHIQKSLILSASMTLLGLWILSLLLKWPPFFQTFGITTPSLHTGLVIFGLISSVFTFFLTPVFNLFSRKNEYEADEFSVQTVKDPESMISSLVKLSKENLSNLTPHPWYSFYHYSHPTTLERAEAIKKI